MRFKFIFLCVFISFIFFIPSILEAREPLAPRFSASAYTGVYTVGQADLMLSLDGDQRHNLYVNPQGAYGSDQQWYGDLGLGYRWIKNDAAILGWYLFAGHSRVENSSGFWITNPGVEVMGSRWDARVNAYIPVAGRSNELGIKEFNIVTTPVFTGHTEILNSVFNDVNAIQQIGNGADARVGYQLFRYVPLKGYLGTYFFSIANTDNVRGGAAGLEYWFDENIRVFANYSYDNYQHSNVVGGIGISFGGVRKHRADPTLSERLTDPVDRYLANLGHGSGIPSKTLLYSMARGSSSVLVSDSIAFFSQTGAPNNGGTGLTLANCTFENPCGPTDFSQTSVNALNTLLPNTMFYFNGGNYTSSRPIQLNPGQSLQSRIADYTQLATGLGRSTVVASQIRLQGNNTLENMILLSPSSTGNIMTISGQDNTIAGSQIGSSSAPVAIGIFDSGNQTLIDNTAIFATGTAYIGSGNTSIIQDSVLNVNAPMNTTATGINIVGSNTNLSVNNTQIEINNASINRNTFGIVIFPNNVVTLNNSTMTVTANNNVTSIANTYDILNFGSLVVDGGSLNANSDGDNVGIVSSSSSSPPDILFSTECQVNGTQVTCS